MALTILETRDERVLGASVTDALRRSVAERGRALLLVPGVPQALDAQRAMAQMEGLAVGVETELVGSWVREMWETWGDGRGYADQLTLRLLADEVLRTSGEDERAPLGQLPGVADVLARLVGRSLPWLPIEGGRERAADCAAAGLTRGETALVRLSARLAGLVAEHGLVTPGEAMWSVPTCLSEAGCGLPGIVVAGFTWLGEAERSLVAGLAEQTDLTFCVRTRNEAASAEARRLAGLLSRRAACTVVTDAEAHALARADEIEQVLDALFGDVPVAADESWPVEFLLPAGPVAEAELICRRVAELTCEGKSVAVVTGDVERAWRDLVPKLERRGVSARVKRARRMGESPSAVTFMGFAREVAHLDALAKAWPEPQETADGPVPVLGPMDWWTPRGIIDFLLQDMAHMSVQKVWDLDRRWRQDRLLTPAKVLEMLQQERNTSASVARATFELLRGRVASAASKLLAGYAAGGETAPGEVVEESCVVLRAVISCVRAMRDLGMLTPTADGDARSMDEVLRLIETTLAAGSISLKVGVGADAHKAQVRIMGYDEAALLDAGSIDCLVATGLTSSERPLAGRERVLEALLVKLGIEPEPDHLASARASFFRTLSAARSRIVFERALTDADGKPTYPSVMLSEAMGALSIPQGASPADYTLAHALRSERLLSENLSRSGEAARVAAVSLPAPAGRLTSTSRSLVFVPREGQLTLEDDKPVLSASQIETYLECPYKWFARSRIGLDGIDAGFGGMEMGTFAHSVLEETRRELLLEALRREEGTEGLTDAELLAALERDPVRHIAGSDVDDGNLEEARAVLTRVFERQVAETLRHDPKRAGKQALVAHDAIERSQLVRLKEDLLSELAYERGVLRGFEPRFFEWRFGGALRRVEYAGAYFVGTVDRIDVSPHGTAVIVDYKHKNAKALPGEYDALADGVMEGVSLPKRVQSLIYAQVVRRAFEGRLRLVGSVYLATRRDHALAGVADANVCDLVFGELRPERAERVAVPALEEGTSGMNTLLDYTEELIAEQVRQMRAGMVEARPRDLDSCAYCPVMSCEKRQVR